MSNACLQAGRACCDAASVGSLLPGVLWHLQQMLRECLHILGGEAIKFHHVWSVLLFALCTPVHVKAAGPSIPG